MLDREIVGVVWQEAGERLFLLYREGDPQRLVSSEAVASQLTREVGLVVEVRSHGSVRWTRNEAEAP